MAEVRPTDAKDGNLRTAKINWVSGRAYRAPIGTNAALATHTCPPRNSRDRHESRIAAMTARLEAPEARGGNSSLDGPLDPG